MVSKTIDRSDEARVNLCGVGADLTGLDDLLFAVQQDEGLMELASDVAVRARDHQLYPWRMVMRVLMARRRSMDDRLRVQLREPYDRELGDGKGPTAWETEVRIRAKCDEIAQMLCEKNRAYGDSALKPIGIFAKGCAVDLLRARIDDKLSRIANSPDAYGEDPVLDLAGYLVLLLIAEEGEVPTR